jgi:hypothetical protein
MFPLPSSRNPPKVQNRTNPRDISPARAESKPQSSWGRWRPTIPRTTSTASSPASNAASHLLACSHLSQNLIVFLFSHFAIAHRSDGLQSRRSGRGRSGGARRSRGSPPRLGPPVAVAGAPSTLPRLTPRRTRWGSRGISLFLFYRRKQNWGFPPILALPSMAHHRRGRSNLQAASRCLQSCSMVHRKASRWRSHSASWGCCVRSALIWRSKPTWSPGVEFSQCHIGCSGLYST